MDRDAVGVIGERSTFLLLKKRKLIVIQASSSLFFSPPAVNARSARVLFLLVAPGHLIFLYTINSLRGGHTTLTPIFISFYLAAALLQVLSQKAFEALNIIFEK